MDEVKQQGVDVKVIEFSDWTTPNIAVENGDIDVNYFQHRPFMKNAMKAGGFALADADIGVLANIGLSSPFGHGRHPVRHPVRDPQGPGERSRYRQIGPHLPHLPQGPAAISKAFANDPKLYMLAWDGAGRS